MTPWLKFSITSAGVGFFEIVGGYLFFRKFCDRSIVLWLDKCAENLTEFFKKRERVAGPFVFLVTWLAFTLTIFNGGTFDEYGYAIAIRDPGFFYHPNHFVPHIFSDLAYRFYFRLTHSLDSLYSTKLVNSLFAAISVFLVYKIIVRLVRHPAVAFFTSLLFGFAFGTWKYAISGEVYTIMMTSLLLCLWYFLGLLQTQNFSTRSLVTLALLANICVYSHNTTATISLAMGLPLLRLQPKLFFRYAFYGLTLFLVMQTLGSVSHGIYTPKVWFHHNFYYAVTGYATANNLVSFNLLRNIPLTLRDGTLTIICGMESAFYAMPLLSKIITLAIYSLVWAAIIGVTLIAFRGIKSLSSVFLKDAVFQTLVLHLVVMGLFASIWTPGNDELLHWLIPYFLFVVVYSLYALKLPLKCVALAMAFLLPLIIFSSLGTSTLSASKILSWRFTHSFLGTETKMMDFSAGDILLYQYDESYYFSNYYFPTARKVDPEENPTFLSGLGNPVSVKRRVFVTTQLLGICPWLREEGKLKQLNTNYWVMESFPPVWKTHDNLRLLVLAGPALR